MVRRAAMRIGFSMDGSEGDVTCGYLRSRCTRDAHISESRYGAPGGLGREDESWVVEEEGRGRYGFAPSRVVGGLVVLGFLRVGSGRCGMLGEGGCDLVEVVFGAVDADHYWVAHAVVVVDVDGGDVLLGLHEEVEWFGAGLRGGDG